MATTGSRGPRTALPLVFLALAGCAAGAPVAGPSPSAAAPAGASYGAPITAEELRARLAILAHDSMRGRETGTPGARMASDYIVRELTRMGVRPAGDGGTYQARVPLIRESTRIEASARTSRGEAALGAADLALLSGLADVPGSPRPSGEGPIVFAGYQADPGVTAAQELRPEQLRGAVLVLRFGVPQGVAAQSARFDVAQLWAPTSPVGAVLLVNEGGPMQQAWEYLQGSSGASLRLDTGAQPATPGGGPPVFIVSSAAAERLVGGPLGRTPRTGLGTFRWRVQEQEARLEAWNIVGVLPGSDPARAGQYVAVGAHYDHIGVTEPVSGDSINNGADDDGSGTASVLAIAARYAALPQAQRPARSLLFVWHTGEEEGLLGSEWLTDHPTVPRDSIVAQINIDMIGRNHPDSVFVVGSRRVSTQLGQLVEAANARQARPLGLDYTFDAPGHPEQIYCRSDHYNYARYGIPITFFTTGLHEDYHKPSDELDKIDFTKLTRIAGLISDIVGQVASAPARPAVDRPVPPLGTPCTQ
ncbi:MAG TPA: M28 family peptidase [Longimicrobiaceae bacterium]|nr:M28 family peptidase [Longimicrobiaceae bacterium]